MNYDDYSKLDYGINVSRYLPSEMIPADPVITRQTVDSRLPLNSHSQVCLLYVCEGEGTITINGRNHSARPGTFVFLMPQHIYTLTPSAEHPLELVRCLCGNGLLLFFEMCPYFDGRTITPATTTALVRMEGEERELAEGILRDLVNGQRERKEDQYDDVQTTLLLMELWGLFFHKLEENGD